MTSSRGMSQTESMILLKDSGLSIACGPTTDGFVWPNLISDMLLQQVLDSDRYEKAIVINFDRSADDLSLVSTISTSRDSRDKMLIVDGTGVTAGIETLSSVLTRVKTAIESSFVQGCHSSEQQLENEEEEERDTAVAVFVYSCSALELAIGSSRTLAFLRSLLSTINLKTAVSKGARGIVVGAVHERLHTAWQLTASFRSLASTYCTCVPNTGQLSPIIAVELHTVRKTTTGRVVEAHELFALPAERGMNKWQTAQLKHIPRMQKDKEGKVSATGGDEDETTAVTGASVGGANMAEVESVFGMDKIGLTVEKNEEDEASKEAAAAAAGGAVSSQNKNKTFVSRLITLQSTDPEFDEDSDPDADLDL